MRQFEIFWGCFNFFCLFSQFVSHGTTGRALWAKRFFDACSIDYMFLFVNWGRNG